jgi:hypothetical protein
MDYPLDTGKGPFVQRDALVNRAVDEFRQLPVIVQEQIEVRVFLHSVVKNQK